MKSRLPPLEPDEVLALRDEGWTVEEIAEHIGVSAKRIRGVCGWYEKRRGRELNFDDKEVGR